nr:hypothetical protein [Tanacetum cinerariifolium]
TSLFRQRERRGCGQPCDGYYYDSCACTRCGMTLFNGICDNCIYGNGKPVICTACGSMNFKVVHKSSISLNTSQISSIHSITPVLSTKEPEQLLSMRYKHLSITTETKSDKVTESNAENLLPIPSECEVTLEDKSKCDLPISENSPVCDNSDIFSESKIDDDISVYNDDFEDIDYVEASLSDPEIVSVEEKNGVEEENVIQHDVYQEEEVDLENISQIEDVVLREKLLSITRLISNIESLNDNSTPDQTSDEVFQANHSIQNEECFENPCNEIPVLNPNQEKEEPPQNSDMRQLIREECCVEVPEKQNITTETESDKVTESNDENLLPIPSECEVTLEDKSKCDLPISENSPVCDNSDIFSESKIDDDISVYNDDFEDFDYVEASLSDPEIVSVEEENGVEEENVIQHDVYQE